MSEDALKLFDSCADIGVEDLKNCGAVFPCKVKDGNGDFVDLQITSFNPLTGVIDYYVKDDKGKYVTKIVRDLNEATTIEVEKARTTAKPPLRVIDADLQDVTMKACRWFTGDQEHWKPITEIQNIPPGGPNSEN